MLLTVGKESKTGFQSFDHTDPATWWRHATVYQIYPRSFCDSNGDGIGDLRGITSKIPYLAEVGVDAVWLSPFYPSPMSDGGYDVADYRNVDSQIGTLEDFDELVKELKRVDIKCIVDIVPNHCSIQHIWFKEALAAHKGSKARDRFIFRDGLGPDKSQPPNDWLSFFGGSAWDPVNDGSDFLKTLRFWSDRGASGFRVDVAMLLAKDISEPYVSDAEQWELRERMMINGSEKFSHPFRDRDEVFEIYEGWRKVFDEYDPPLTAVAEATVARHRQPLYASEKGLGQCFNFDTLFCPYNAKNLEEVIKNSLNLVSGKKTITTWVLSNHDVVRHASKYGLPGCTEHVEHVAPRWLFNLSQDYLNSGGKDCDVALGLKRGKAMAMLILALPGSTYLYQGEELGLSEVLDIPDSARQDPTFFRTRNDPIPQIGRDGCRIPIPWTAQPPSFGFSPNHPDTKPHLPMPDWFADRAAEYGGWQGTLELYKKALRMRKRFVKYEDIEWLESEEGCLRFRRGDWEVVINLGVEQGVQIPDGELILTSSEPIGGIVPLDTTVWVRLPHTCDLMRINGLAEAGQTAVTQQATLGIHEASTCIVLA